MLLAELVRRIIYTSRSIVPDDREVLSSILTSSRRNNGIDGVSGVLWAEGDRYLQLLEGPPESVEGTFARIAHDPRHADVRVIEDRSGVERQFGDWAMASIGRGEKLEDGRQRLAMLLSDATDDVRRYFDLDQQRP